MDERPLNRPPVPPLGTYPGPPPSPMIVPPGRGPLPPPSANFTPVQFGRYGHPHTNLINYPPGSWTAHKSGDSVYYYNTVTRVSQWPRPYDYAGDPTIVTEKPKPVSSERVVNTIWTEVTCEDSRIYYYNLENKTAVWEIPDPVLRIKFPEFAGPHITSHQGVQVSVNPNQIKEPRRLRKATDEEIQFFKTLLEESGVSAYSRYEKEATKLQDDPRWKGVPMEKERRSLFLSFCRGKADEQRKSSKSVRDLSRKPSIDSSVHSKEDSSLVDYQETQSERKRGAKEVVDPRASAEKKARVEQDVQESRRRFEKASHEAAVSDYRTLLSEVVKQADFTWREVRDRLESDIQGRGTSPHLSDREREKIFTEHVNKLRDAAVRDFKQALKEKITFEALECIRSLSEAEEVLGLDFAGDLDRDTRLSLWESHVARLKDRST